MKECVAHNGIRSKVRIRDGWTDGVSDDTKKWWQMWKDEGLVALMSRARVVFGMIIVSPAVTRARTR